MTHPKLIEDPRGMMFEYLDEKEAEFLYEEVFVRRSYLQHGLIVSDGAVVIDAGANIGLFSLQCLREATGVQVYAFEPIPAIYSVLVRNLYTSIDSVKTGICPRPVVLRVALGAEQSEEEFRFFGGSPGESTRHPEEREQQQQTLLRDPNAVYWRQALGPPQSPPQNNSAAELQGDAGAARPLTVEDGDRGSNGECREATGAMEVDNELPCSPETDLPTAVANMPPAIEIAACGSGSVAPRTCCKTREDEREKKKSVIDHQDRPDEDAARGKDCEGGEKEGVETFFCSVVPLSLAFGELGLATVDLLKVDVEGDELAVLRGIADEDWPKIKQIALEVHDVDGRLAATVELLRSHPAAFEEVCWEPQVTSEVRGYVMVVPEALKMFLVFAKRRPKVAVSKSPVATVVDGVRISSGSNDAGDGGAENSRLSGFPLEGQGDRRDKEDMPSKFCSCVAVGCSMPR